MRTVSAHITAYVQSIQTETWSYTPSTTGSAHPLCANRMVHLWTKRCTNSGRKISLWTLNCNI